MPTRTKKKRPVAKKKKVMGRKKAMKKTVKKAVRSVKKRKLIAKKVTKKLLKKVMVLGRVTHYFGRINVAIVELAQPLKVGDTVRVKHGLQDYTMTVTSMQIDHMPVMMAKKKDVIGMKTAKKVPPGAVLMPA